MFSVTVILVILGVLSKADEIFENTFEPTRGCRQYNVNQGYNSGDPYLYTDVFRNVRIKTDNTKVFRFGVLGSNDGILRLALDQVVAYPYVSTSMHEIVLSGWNNTRTAVRRYNRTGPAIKTGEIVLRDQPSDGLLSVFKPLMFTLTIHPNGAVKLRKDGEYDPFLEFTDKTLSSLFVGFCNWDVPVIFFFDCPLVDNPW